MKWVTLTSALSTPSLSLENPPSCQTRTSGTANTSSRRQFLTQTSVAVAGVAAFARLPLVHAAPPETDLEVKIGLIGCGGRGTGAALDALGAATKVIYPSAGYHTEDVAEGAKVERPNIKVVALADLFEDRLVKCRGQLAEARHRHSQEPVLHRLQRLPGTGGTARK